VSHDERFEEAGARFWETAKALIVLKNIDLLDAATDAMRQQAKEFAEGINGPHVGCMCERCIELREQIAAQPADAPDPTDAW
jgi:hypothetical protein